MSKLLGDACHRRRLCRCDRASGREAHAPERGSASSRCCKPTVDKDAADYGEQFKQIHLQAEKDVLVHKYGGPTAAKDLHDWLSSACDAVRSKSFAGVSKPLTDATDQNQTESPIAFNEQGVAAACRKIATQCKSQSVHMSAMRTNDPLRLSGRPTRDEHGTAFNNRHRRLFRHRSLRHARTGQLVRPPRWFGRCNRSQSRSPGCRRSIPTRRPRAT